MEVYVMNKKSYLSRLGELCESMAMANGVMNAGLAMHRKRTK